MAKGRNSYKIKTLKARKTGEPTSKLINEMRGYYLSIINQPSYHVRFDWVNSTKVSVNMQNWKEPFELTIKIWIHPQNLMKQNI